ncbi:GNAT family N-acetyltransferase [Rhizobium sp. RU20A]|uniref:GNAT family N-acetyltransferase n=1 Tax=Rhizobium sp. RU20A TaxID=1907412 RepID=UPI0032B0088A
MRSLQDFSAVDLYAMLKLRGDVFVVEQACAYADLDGKDIEALHLRLLSAGELLACARLFAPGASGGARIGRVAVSPDHRGKKLGEALMRTAIAECERRFPGRVIEISAQSYLLGFYRALGFEPVSQEYLEDGIAHVDMVRPSDMACR